MAGNVKDITITNLATGAVVYADSFDVVKFEENWAGFYEDATGSWIYYNNLFIYPAPRHSQIVVCPKGVAYPGDAVPGTGAKKVFVVFDATFPIPSVTMTGVESVDTETGWIRIIKGDFVIAYSPFVVHVLIVSPM